MSKDIQNVVNIFHERLLYDLGVVKQEHRLLAGIARPHQQLLQVFAPLDEAIALGDLDAEAVKLGDGGGERRERLAPAAADAHQQRVAERLLDAAHALVRKKYGKKYV